MSAFVHEALINLAGTTVRLRTRCGSPSPLVWSSSSRMVICDALGSAG
jgi:hypothetical protein